MDARRGTRRANAHYGRFADRRLSTLALSLVAFGAVALTTFWISKGAPYSNGNKNHNFHSWNSFFDTGGRGRTSSSAGGLVQSATVGLVAAALGGSSARHVQVFSAYYSNDVTTSLKLRQDFAASPLVDQHTVLNLDEQREYLRTTNCADGEAVKRFQELVNDAGKTIPAAAVEYHPPRREHLAVELWKYCALYHEGGMYFDAQSPLVDTLDHILGKEQENMAVLNDPAYHPNSIHGSLLILRRPRSTIAEKMIQLLTTTPLDTLDASPLLVPRTLYGLIAKDVGMSLLPPAGGNVGTNWFLLLHRCTVDPLQRAHISAALPPNEVNSYR
jgi:hypothetical protein